jgi:hypothetical protein
VLLLEDVYTARALQLLRCIVHAVECITTQSSPKVRKAVY